jgi:RNA polymerase II subunit A C-terminal domain phosphatase SSU72
MVCSSNQNRSMEAHFLFKRQGFDVSSYGTGTHVKLPGPSLREPNVYEFGTPYKYMLDELRRKDPELYPFIIYIFISFIDYPFDCFS